MNSGFLKLNLSDLGKGIVVAVITVILSSLQQMVSGHGLDVASYDWAGMLDLAFKAAGAYLLKNLISDSDGKVLGGFSKKA